MEAAMAQSASGGGQKPVPKGVTQSLGSAKLVVENVEVIRTRIPIEIPEIIRKTEETTQYVVKNETTTRYIPSDEPTTRYVPREVETIRYIPREEQTTRYLVDEVRVEKPICIDTPYERPIVTNKEYTLVTFKDLEAIREAIDLLPKLVAEVKELRKVKIVEEVVKVPKINYVPTDVFRITQSGELVKE
jgi:hypothetical protein